MVVDEATPVVVDEATLVVVEGPTLVVEGSLVVDGSLVIDVATPAVDASPVVAGVVASAVLAVPAVVGLVAVGPGPALEPKVSSPQAGVTSIARAMQATNSHDEVEAIAARTLGENGGGRQASAGDRGAPGCAREHATDRLGRVDKSRIAGRALRSRAGLPGRSRRRRRNTAPGCQVSVARGR